MNVSDFISQLDDARYGQRRVNEDEGKSSEGTAHKGYKQPSGSIPKPIAEKPSHAPTSTAQFKTTGQAKSKDEGETVEKGYKQPSASIPAPVAKAPSHAPTDGKDATTKGQGSSKDEGEGLTSKAIKETIRSLIDDDEPNLALLSERGAHKAGCQCGFCKNKGSFGKKKEEGEGEGDDKKEEKMESRRPVPRRTVQEYYPGPGALPAKRRIGGERIGFRSQVPRRPGMPQRPGAGAPPPKAAINPMQPSMESVQRAADQLLEAPE